MGLLGHSYVESVANSVEGGRGPLADDGEGRGAGGGQVHLTAMVAGAAGLLTQARNFSICVLMQVLLGLQGLLRKPLKFGRSRTKIAVLGF
jgi:hypothetical protein